MRSALGSTERWLKFMGAGEGEANLKDEPWGGFFEPPRAKARFAKFSHSEELGTIIWADGADFERRLFYQGPRPAQVRKPAAQGDAA